MIRQSVISWKTFLKRWVDHIIIFNLQQKYLRSTSSHIISPVEYKSLSYVCSNGSIIRMWCSNTMHVQYHDADYCSSKNTWKPTIDLPPSDPLFSGAQYLQVPTSVHESSPHDSRANPKSHIRRVKSAANSTLNSIVLLFSRKIPLLFWFQVAMQFFVFLEVK